jgi:hypothetical protein
MIVLAAAATLVIILGGRWRMSVAHLMLGVVAWALFAVGHSLVAGTLFLIGWGALYLLSLGPWPQITCRRCEGSHKIRGFGIFRQAHRRGCRYRWCNRGSRVRAGVRVLNRRRAVELMSE